eukprot:COSAG05_NODE_20_length_33177_cov_336.302639_5_plen_78_part_00
MLVTCACLLLLNNRYMYRKLTFADLLNSSAAEESAEPPAPAAAARAARAPPTQMLSVCAAWGPAGGVTSQRVAVDAR